MQPALPEIIAASIILFPFAALLVISFYSDYQSWKALQIQVGILRNQSFNWIISSGNRDFYQNGKDRQH